MFYVNSSWRRWTALIKRSMQSSLCNKHIPKLYFQSPKSNYLISTKLLLPCWCLQLKLQVLVLEIRLFLHHYWSHWHWCSFQHCYNRKHYRRLNFALLFENGGWTQTWCWDVSSNLLAFEQVCCISWMNDWYFDHSWFLSKLVARYLRCIVYSVLQERWIERE